MGFEGKRELISFRAVLGQWGICAIYRDGG